ncbi:MAG: 30S ribosome-binding factor RbfA [Oligoflexia bacterium]|nr:30S ribosome-binding factor RbfA [Oligoflexia bacterium]
MKAGKSFPRSSRVADLIKEEVADILLFGVRDPRIRDVSITDVRIKDDLKIARIYYVSHEGDDKNIIAEGLGRAKGFIRSELARRIKIRRMPDLEFYYDDVFESGLKFDIVLKRIKKEE